MTTYGLTSQGFSPKTLAVIDAEIDAALKAAFGPETDTSAESVFGQLKGIFAEREALLWGLAEQVFLSAYPDYAAGVALDNALGLTGHIRYPATMTRINGVALTGISGTVVPAGTIFSVDGSPEKQFLTETDVTLSGSGDTVDCVAPETGPITVNAGTLTKIDTPVAGLTGVTNPAPAIPGRNPETDAELRIRRSQTLQRSGAATAGAIRSAVLDLNAVAGAVAIDLVQVFENTGSSVDSEGRPPKSFEVIVRQAGDASDRDEEIAQAIYGAKPAGIQAYGDVTIMVPDITGLQHSVSFSRPTKLPVYLEIELTVTSSYPADGDNKIKEAATVWGNGLGLGGDVIVYPMLVAQISAVAGITNARVRIGTAPGPTVDDNIYVGETEISDWDVKNIIVTHT